MGGGLWWGGKRDGIIGEAAIKFGDVGGRDGFSAGVSIFQTSIFSSSISMTTLFNIAIIGAPVAFPGSTNRIYYYYFHYEDDYFYYYYFYHFLFLLFFIIFTFTITYYYDNLHQHRHDNHPGQSDQQRVHGRQWRLPCRRHRLQYRLRVEKD